MQQRTVLAALATIGLVAALWFWRPMDPPVQPRATPPPPPAPGVAPAPALAPAPPVASAPARPFGDIHDPVRLAELDLRARLARLEFPVTPEVETLLEKRRQGVPPDQLRQFVRQHFPPNLRLRVEANRWIASLDRPAPPAAPAPGDAGPAPPLGTLEKRP